ncbi:MAG: hypothetical protein GX456_15285 [Verrucomicrobia bacterium]|nr:hypothetical protein [Verrucomicrobiota bacterium]
MERTTGILWHDQQQLRPLLVAFAISLAFHLLLFTAIDLGSRAGFWQFTPFGMLAKALGLDPNRLQLSKQLLQSPASADRTTASKPQEEEMPRLFVDVDPSQATDETPPNTAYYSPFNSLAANPDTSRDTGTPKIDGTQDKVLKTKDTLRPIAQPQPLQPAQPPPNQPEEESSPQEAKQQIPPPVVAQPIKPVQPSEPPQPPGETLMARATPVMPKIDASSFFPTETGENKQAHTRYRRVADALAARQINPYSALVGEKFKQDGGVKRYSISSSVDVRASPFGSYDARFIAAVQQCWYALLEEHRYSLDRMGKVVLEFRLTSDGRITEMRVVESDVGEIFTTICELAVTKPAPYEKWPADLRKIVGTDYRDVRFTFYY